MSYCILKPLVRFVVEASTWKYKDVIPRRSTFDLKLEILLDIHSHKDIILIILFIWKLDWVSKITLIWLMIFSKFLQVFMKMGEVLLVFPLHFIIFVLGKQQTIDKMQWNTPNQRVIQNLIFYYRAKFSSYNFLWHKCNSFKIHYEMIIRPTMKKICLTRVTKNT